jgi:hypothetical protein
VPITDKKSDKSMAAEISELKDLLVRYAKQETIEPLKGVVRFLAWGVAGSVLLSLGAVLLGVGVLRVIEDEAAPHLTGNLSWIPYVVVFVYAGLIIGLCVRAIGSEKRKIDRERLALTKEKR